MSEQSEREHTKSCVGPLKRRQGPSDQAPPAKKHGVSKASVNKWIHENDKTLSTATWLKFDTDTSNRGVAVALRCSVCKQFCDKLVGMLNYNSTYSTLNAPATYDRRVSKTMLPPKCTHELCNFSRNR